MKKRNINQLLAKELVSQKRYEFLRDFKDMTYSEMCESFGFSWDELTFSELNGLMGELLQEHLFSNDEILNLNIKSHYRNQDGYEVFGLQLMSKYDLEDQCDTVTEWYAIGVVRYSGQFGMADCHCTESSAVRKSPFVGKTVREVLEYIYDLPEFSDPDLYI